MSSSAPQAQAQAQAQVQVQAAATPTATSTHTGTDTGAPLRIAGLLPFRGLLNPKSRLGETLVIDDRRELALTLVQRAILAVLDAGVDPLAVVTLDPELAASHADGRFDSRATLLVQPRPGLNAAIRLGQRWAIEQGCDALLIVLPDLPLLTAGDIRAICALAAPHSAVIAPDRHGRGTNALLLAPPDAIPPAFGVDSALRHRTALALAEIGVTDVQRPGTWLDVDTPDDLTVLGHTQRLQFPAPLPFSMPAHSRSQSASPQAAVVSTYPLDSD